MSLTYTPVKGQWLKARPDRSVRFQRQTGSFSLANILFCINCHYSVILTGKRNTTDIIYLGCPHQPDVSPNKNA
jgi:hypothetical protein